MYEYKELYTIDFSNVKQYTEMHLVIRDALDFPDYYGRNWSAFWDCLTDMYGESIHIEIIGLDVIEKQFDDAATKMLEILRRFKHFSNDAYADDILIEVVRGSVRQKIE